MSKNDITGDRLVSKTSTDAYRDGFDAIFGKKAVSFPIYGKKEEFDSEKEMVGHITGQPTPCEHLYRVDSAVTEDYERTATCQKCGKTAAFIDTVTAIPALARGVPKPPPGYTAEELERDNPHNQWMYEK